MTRAQIFAEIQKKRSFLCVGLDTDLAKIPKHLLEVEDPIFEFNKQIIDATQAYCIAYKPNIAFYEALGVRGWESLRKTIEYIPEGLFTIADAKRGDIGNTASMYAKAFFEQMRFDSITVSPYMGEDSVKPFLLKDKWAILLALTSNNGSADFQRRTLAESGRPLYEEVIRKSQEWGSPDQIMYVVGATQAEKILEIRALAPEHFFLIPGIGAQGGDLDLVAKGMNAHCGLIVNSARSIIYASDDIHFARRAEVEARALRDTMDGLLQRMP
ncbi:MAG: orotidine-5'-phosphate decarboxylase [Chryseolinea sp.]